MITAYIKENWIFALGFLAQLIFGMRIVIQWWIAENERRAVSPVLYWNLSVVASVLFLLYGVLRGDAVIIVGQFVAYYIYVRNLYLKRYWQDINVLWQIILLIAPFAIVYSTAFIGVDSEYNHQVWDIFLWIGFLGQALLNIRFLYQLYYSEKAKESTLPPGFWWLSVGGAVLIIAYAFHRNDPVLLISQGLSLVPYVRNVMLTLQR